jgi:hypothetical protein
LETKTRTGCAAATWVTTRLLRRNLLLLLLRLSLVWREPGGTSATSFHGRNAIQHTLSVNNIDYSDKLSTTT